MKKSQVFFYLSLLFSAIVPGVYLLYIFGVFEDGIFETTTAVSTGIYVALGFMVYQIFRTLQKRATDLDNPNHGQRAIGAALSQAMPWLLLLLFTGLIYFGISNIVTHVTMIVGMELVASAFTGLSKFYQLKEGGGIV